MRNISRVIAASALAALTMGVACKAQESGSVYFYRYKQFEGAALQPSVYCDEAEIARISNGRYFVVQLPAGTHTCRSNDKQSGVELKVEPKEEYYLRVEIVTGAFKGHGRLVLTPKEQGAFEVKKLKVEELPAPHPQ